MHYRGHPKGISSDQSGPEGQRCPSAPWYENLDSRTVIEYRYTRVIFGSGPSPYILGATPKKHVS